MARMSLQSSDGHPKRPVKKVFATQELKYLAVLPEAGKKGEDGERKVKVA